MVSRDEKLLNGGGLATVWKEIKDRDQIATEDIAELNDKVASLNTSLAGKADASTVSTLSTAVSANTASIADLNSAVDGAATRYFAPMASTAPVSAEATGSSQSVTLADGTAVTGRTLLADLEKDAADVFVRVDELLISPEFLAFFSDDGYPLVMTIGFTSPYGFGLVLLNVAYSDLDSTVPEFNMEDLFDPASTEDLDEYQRRRYHLAVSLASDGSYTMYLGDTKDGFQTAITPNQYGDGHVWNLINLGYSSSATNSMKTRAVNSWMTFDVNGTGSSGIMYGTVDEVEVHDNVLTLTATGTAGELSTITLYSDGTYAEQVNFKPVSQYLVEIAVTADGTWSYDMYDASGAALCTGETDTDLIRQKVDPDDTYGNALIARGINTLCRFTVTGTTGGRDYYYDVPQYVGYSSSRLYLYGILGNKFASTDLDTQPQAFLALSTGGTINEESIADDSTPIVNRVKTLPVSTFENDVPYLSDEPGGKEWRQSNITTNGIFYSAISNGSIWVAASHKGEGLWYSTDGMTWTQSNITSDSVKGIYSDGNIWVAGSYNYKGLWYSTDGMTWTQSNNTSGNFYGVHSNGSIWVAAGGDNTGLWYSTDGMTWTQSNITSGFFNFAQGNENIWIAGKVSGGLYYSTDGMTWTQSSITAGSFAFAHSDGSIWVTGGNALGLRYSTDGMTWTQSNITSGNFYGVHSNGSIWVAAGYSNKGFYYSTDGMTWTQSNITSVTTSAIYYDGTIWVAGSSNNKGLYYSTDGMTWTQSNITSGYFYSVYSDGNIWVAGGDRYSLPNDYIDRKELNAALNEALPDTGWKEISVLDDFQEMLSQLISGGALESCGIEFMTVIADVEGDNNRAKQFVKLPSVRFGQYDVDGTVYTSIYAEGFLTYDTTMMQSLTATIEFNTGGVLTKTVYCLTLDLYDGSTYAGSSSELSNASIWYRLL